MLGILSLFIAQIASHNSNQTVDATNYMKFDVSLLILEIYIDQEIIAQVIEVEEQETMNAEDEYESVDE